MEYIQVAFTSFDLAIREELMAELSEIGYEGFEETDEQLLAFIPTDIFDESVLIQIAKIKDTDFITTVIPQQNWNAQWESDFQPVIVPGFCTVRADFHKKQVDTPFDIVITPKMSFGTGHHATTQLMMMQMRGLDLKDKKILDFGTGTGILAILAEMMGAAEILAIDNDEWSYTNALENLERNSSKNITVKQGSLDVVNSATYDIIFANINRHILLQYANEMSGLLKTDSKLLLSGILVEDRDMIINAFVANKCTFIAENSLNNWMVVEFNK
ncbi:MAG: 50S ribosomal protein L11 methyltransferase [Bacteroidota bacterium]